MTWTKAGAIGPQWKTWTPNLRLVCDVSSPTATQCPGSITGLSWGTCKYTTFNNSFFGFLNLTMSNTGSYPYGGTRNHWDLELPYAVEGWSGPSNPAVKRIGQGFWSTDTSPPRQGKVIAGSFPNLPRNCAIAPIKETSLSVDSWAKANLTYDWNWVEYWNGSEENTNIVGETFFPTNSWSWRRLGSDNSAWSGSAEAWAAPTPTVTVSIAFNYIIANWA